MISTSDIESHLLLKKAEQLVMVRVTAFERVRDAITKSNPRGTTTKNSSGQNAIDDSSFNGWLDSPSFKLAVRALNYASNFVAKDEVATRERVDGADSP
jgi:hypothetical protein